MKHLRLLVASPAPLPLHVRDVMSTTVPLVRQAVVTEQIVELAAAFSERDE